MNRLLALRATQAAARGCKVVFPARNELLARARASCPAKDRVVVSQASVASGKRKKERATTASERPKPKTSQKEKKEEETTFACSCSYQLLLLLEKNVSTKGSRFSEIHNLVPLLKEEGSKARLALL
jgi:hypothetical protein